MNTEIIAHRGASALAKHENTLEAFEIAINLHCDFAEFDIRKTSDDVLIVFHDDAINDKAISSLTYEELNKEAAKDDYQVPLLKDVLKLCKNKIKLDIEIKETGYEKQIVDMVTHYISYDQFMMKSFIDKTVKLVHHIDPQIKVGLLLGVPKGSISRRFNEIFPLRRVKACKADFVSPNQKLVTSYYIKRMHKANKPIYVWTVNEPKSIARFFSKKVDGIITDYPNVAIKIKKRF